MLWRASALDIANGIEPSSATQARRSTVVACHGCRRTPGHAQLGRVGHLGRSSPDRHVYDGANHEQRVYDLLDRGFDPQGALNWMNSNGYPTVGVYYPGPQVIGFPYDYMAFVNGAWELVIRVGG